MLRLLAACLIVVAVAGGGSALAWAKAAPKAEGGVLDLRQWDFAKDGPVLLDGEWELFWERLLDGADQTGATVADDGFYPVPRNSWTGFVLPDGRILGSTGYATFRLRVLLPKTDAAGASIFAIGRTFANSNQALAVFDSQGRLLGPPNTKGRVGTTPETSVPVWTHKITPLQSADEAVVVWKISDFHSFKAGPQVAPVLGPYAQVHEDFVIKIAQDFFIVGLLVIMAVYHLVVFYLNKQDHAAFWFGVYCFQIAGFSLVINGHANALIENTLFWDLQIKVYYALFIDLAVPVFLLFMQSVIPGRIHRGVSRLVIANGAVLAAIRFATPSAWSSYLSVHTYFLAGLILFLVYLGYIVVTALRTPARRQAQAMAFGLAVLLAAAVNDTLMVVGAVPYTFFLIPGALCVMILCQAFAVAVNNQQIYQGKIAAEQMAAKAGAEALTAHQEAMAAMLARQDAEIANQVLSRAANLDALTQIANRRRFD